MASKGEGVQWLESLATPSATFYSTQRSRAKKRIRCTRMTALLMIGGGNHLPIFEDEFSHDLIDMMRHRI